MNDMTYQVEMSTIGVRHRLGEDVASIQVLEGLPIISQDENGVWWALTQALPCAVRVILFTPE